MNEEKLPKGWKNFKIGELSDQVNGKAFKPTDWSTSGVPIIRIQNLNNHKADFNYSTKEIEEKYHVKNGDLLFAWSGTPGTSFGAHIWERGFAYLNQHIFNIKITSDKIDKRFYYYAFKIAVEKFINQAQGTAGLAHITKGKFENTEIPVPPIPEQQRIVARLDAVFGHLDRVREKLDRIPELLKNFRQQVLTQAVTGELTRDGDTMPEWVELNSLVENSFYGPRFSKDSYTPDGIPTVRTTDMTEKGELIVTNETPRVKVEEKKLESFRVKKGDLLITRTGSIGKMAIYNGVEPVIPSAYLIRFRFNQKVITRFVFYCLTSPYGQKVMGLNSTAITQPNLNAEKIKSIKIPLYNLESQKEILKKIDEMFLFADKIESQYQSLKAKIDQMPQAILAKAFRGELVAQEVKEYVREIGELGMVAEGNIELKN